MKAAKLAVLGEVLALARRAAEVRLARLSAGIARGEARCADLRAALAAPLDAASLSESGGLTAELDWRRGLAVEIAAEESRIIQLRQAAEAARADLKRAFGRECAAERLTEAAAADEARRSGRLAEDQSQPRRPRRG